MKPKIKSKMDIKYGNSDVNLSNLRPKEIKVRITTFLDSDVLIALKVQAKDLGVGYQTYLNGFLREALLKEPGAIARLKRIEAILGKDPDGNADLNPEGSGWLSDSHLIESDRSGVRIALGSGWLSDSHLIESI